MDSLPYAQFGEISLNKIVRTAIENLNDKFAAFLSKNAEVFKDLLKDSDLVLRNEITDALESVALPQDSTYSVEILRKSLGLRKRPNRKKSKGKN